MTHCFSSYSSVVSLTRSKLTLQGQFEVGGEVDAKFKVSSGNEGDQSQGSKTKTIWTNFFEKIIKIDQGKYCMRLSTAKP